MIRNYMAIIYLGDNKQNISPLTKVRSLASIPVGGSYRIIDFALSNVVNSGIRNVGLFCGNEELNSLQTILVWEQNGIWQEKKTVSLFLKEC